MAEDKETHGKEHSRPYRSTSGRAPSYQQGGEMRGSSVPATRDMISRGYGPGSPFSMMRRFAEGMDRIFNDFGIGGSMIGSDRWAEPVGLGSSFWSPEIETFRRNDKIVVRADLPGLDKDSVNVEIDEDVLMISGQREDENKEERDDFYRSERSYGRFYRAIPLPEGVDDSKVEAKFKDGVLEVTLPAPKETSRERKRITVK